MNKLARDQYKDGNEGLIDPGRRGRQRPEELCCKVPFFDFTFEQSDIEMQSCA